MTVEAAIVSHLKLDPGVSALISITRIYQLTLPQQAILPAVRVALVGEPVSYHLRGSNNVKRAMVQVDAFASETDAAHPQPYVFVGQLADALDAALSGQIFTDGGSPVSVLVHECLRQSRRPMYDPDELRQVRIMQDYVVQWTGGS